MKADVYAGDLAMSSRDLSAKAPRTFVFKVEADADPDALLRIVNQLNLANRAPAALTLVGSQDETVLVEARIDLLTMELADLITRKLAQLTCVREAQCSATAVEQLPPEEHS